MMRKLYGAAALGLMAAAFAACLFPDLSSLESGGTGANHPTGPGSGAGKGTGGGNATSSDGTGASSAGGSGVGGGVHGCELGSKQHGSKGVLNEGTGVTGRCIDVTETTWLEYTMFLDATGDSTNDKPTLTGDLASVCSWKNSIDYAYEPEDYLWSDWMTDPTDWNDHPVAGVDWCDAAVYCAWAGKSLCGDDKGNPIVRLLDGGWETRTEWYAACMKNRSPDGGLENPSCFPPSSGPDLGQTDPASGCYGAMGLAHTVSNVWEWEANCTGDQNLTPDNHENDDCRFRGWVAEFTTGGGDDEANHCFSPNPGTDSHRGDPMGKPNRAGIRCCWSASP